MRFLPQFRIIGNRVGIPDDPVAVYAEHFFQPEGGHCGNGKTRKCEDAQVRRPAFLFVFIGTAMDRNL